MNNETKSTTEIKARPKADTMSESSTRSKTKFFTKDKVCFFVIGVLLGAVVASAGFLIYTNVNGNNSATSSQNGMGPGMGGGTPPEMPSGEMPDGGTPPDMPDGEAPSDASSSNQQDSSSSSSNSSSSSSSSDSSKSRPQKPTNSNNSNTSTN